MIGITSQEYLAFERSEVFAAGIRPETWPEVRALALEFDETELAIGGLLRIGINMSNLNLGVDCRITEFEPNEAVLIEGKSRLACASLLFKLEDEGEGTNVNLSLSLQPKSMMARAAAPKVQGFLAQTLPEFTAGYRENVTNFLLGQASATEKAI